jgi:hypothetical protein
MTHCPACGKPVADSRFCPNCGAAVAAAPVSTIAHIPGSTAPVRSAADGRFALGEVVAGRFRMVAALGKGGMGEVYRADDLTLGQPVALKFLPADVADDTDRLTRFRQEVAAARRVSHPNVCRVYDIADHAGRPFLAMEYIDGEDLASLLRRVGRLPEEKGLQIARELCSALAAVHAQGLLHRDLKPANVMLDGRGRVRLTDFGLAVAPDGISAAEARAGTPLYMAPEQLSGRGVSERSDLFAVGLVLYELFTGKRAFSADNVQDLVRQHTEGVPERPSSVAGGIPPAVERLILRCLAPEPDDRPASAAEVLAALPGGDPLAAALAAGETPSPKLVAAAGGAGHLGSRAAAAVLTAALGTILLAAALNDRAALFRRVPQDLSPRELEVRARKITQQLGYTDLPTDRARAIATNDELIQLLRERDRGPGRWAGIDRGWPAAMYFWQRQGPDLLTQRLTPADATGWSMPGRVTPRDPPLREPGETCVFLDLAGRLIEFHAVPPSSLPDDAAAPADWDQLFAAADLDPARFQRVPPTRVPPVFADQTAAWAGTHPDRPDLPVRIEAAAFRRRPVYFHMGPEGTQDRIQVEAGPATLADVVQDVQYGLLGLAGVTIGAWLAWRNRRDGRADRSGAMRLAVAFAAFTMLGWVFTAKHVPDPSDELAMFAGMGGRVLWDAVALWLAYLALEPFVRRRTPQQMIGWNRLLQGRWRDPRVGRDVLLGVLVGTVGEGLAIALHVLLPLAGYPTEWRITWDAALTEGAGTLLTLAGYALLTGVRDFFLFVLLRLVCRRDWIAAVLAIVLLSAPSFVGADPPYVKGLSTLVFYTLAFVLLVRFGFLAYLVANLAGNVVSSMPIALDLSAWYVIPSTVSLLVLAGLAVYGYLIATRGHETG